MLVLTSFCQRPRPHRIRICEDRQTVKTILQIFENEKTVYLKYKVNEIHFHSLNLS